MTESPSNEIPNLFPDFRVPDHSAQVGDPVFPDGCNIGEEVDVIYEPYVHGFREEPGFLSGIRAAAKPAYLCGIPLYDTDALVLAGVPELDPRRGLLPGSLR
ncbi:hypothetical protein [Streptomyces sp. NBC_01508]|uniref:hypothetical protein n=1 Tax=Streptomyces sp. NBC_01508 TaxID=2903888 RepID=UPI00386DEDB0